MYVCYVSTNKCCIVYNSYAEEPILNKKFHQYQTPSQLHKEHYFTYLFISSFIKYNTRGRDIDNTLC